MTDDAMSATFLGLKTASQLQFLHTDGNKIDVAPHRLIRFGDEPVVDIASGVLFTDGSFLACRIHHVSKVSATISSRMIARSTIPLSQVRGFALHLPTDITQRATIISEMNQASGEEDQLLLVNGDIASGLLKLPSSHSSASPAMRSEWRLQVGNATQAYEARQIRAVVLSPRLHAMERPRDAAGFWFAMADGSRLAIRGIDSTDDDLVMKLFSGARVSSVESEAAFLKNIRAIEPIGPIASMLSTMTPADYKQSAELSSLTWPLGINSRIDGGPIVMNGIRYRHGLSMHANARAIFRIPESMNRFQAQLGLLPSYANRTGSVVFEISGVDASKTVHSRFRSKVMRGGDKPLAVDVPLENDVLLMLFVQDAGDGSSGDHGVWIDARLSQDRE